MKAPLAPDRDVVRGWRRQVRATIAASATLRADCRRAPRRRHYGVLIGPLRWLVSGALAAATGMGVPAETAGGLLVAWATIVTLHLTGRFQAGAQNRATLWPYYVLPTNEDDLFAQQFRERMHRALWLAGDFLVFGFIVALQAPATALGWIAVPLFAAAQGALALALGATLAATFPRVPFATLTWLAAWLCWMAGIFLKDGTSVGAALAQRGWQLLTQASPAGWTMNGFLSTAIDHRPLSATVALMALSALAVLPWARRRLRTQLDLTLLFAEPPASAAINGGEERPAVRESAEPGKEHTQPAIPAAAVASALRRELDAAPGGWLRARGAWERQGARLLSPRQRVLVDFFRPHGVLPWRRGWLAALGVIALAWAWLTLGGSASVAVVGSVGALAVGALPVLGGIWSGFSPVANFQVHIGLNSFHPIGFGEAAGLMLRLNALRTLLAMPLVLLAARYGLSASPAPWIEAGGWTCTVTLLVLALQPCWAILAHSKNTNDARAHWWLTALIVVVMLGAAFGGILSIVALGGTGGGWSAARGALGLLAYTHAALAGYGWCYHRTLFDTAAVPRR
jgi:hypothetical protein